MDLYSFMEREFISSNYYDLSFTLTINENSHSAFVFSHNPNVDTLDGVFLYNDRIEFYIDDELIETIYDVNPTGSMNIVRQGTVFTFFANDVQVYETEQISWNTVGAYDNNNGYAQISATNFILKPYIVTEITPSTANYDGTTFGSNIHLELDDNQLSLIDYGMLPQGAVGGGKVILNDVPLESANKYAIQLEMKYNNSRFERLNNLTGQMQMRVYEDIMSSDTVKDYEKTLCSPMPVPNSRTVFTRHSNEGTLYFVQDPLNANSSFLTNAYNQYKGGVEITTETGISLFNLDNAHSPVFVGNELVRAEFHRRSGFIRLARYDESTGDWVNVNTLKLRNYPQLSLNEYNDDYAEVQFGNTTWKFYRGRPFIVLNHSKDDLRIMNLVDRVYCETVENQRGMGFIEEHDANCSVFNPQLSIQQFKQELHIGENIRLDNFELYEAIDNSNKFIEFDSDDAFVNVFNDDGITASHNSNMQLYQGVRTITNTGTLLETDSNNRWDIRPNNFGLFDTPFNVEFDVVDTSNRLAITLYDSSTSIIGEWDSRATLQSGDKIRVEVSDTNANFYVNDVLKSTKTYTSTSKVKFRVFYNVANNYLKYKNFKVTELDKTKFTTGSAPVIMTPNDNALTLTHVSGLYLVNANKGGGTEFDYTGDFSVEFDIVGTPNNVTLQIYENNSTNFYSKSLNQIGALKPCHIKIVKIGTEIYTFVDGVENVGQRFNSDLTGKCRFAFRCSTSGSFTFKNLKIYKTGLDIGEISTNSQLGILNIDNDNALQIYKDDTKLALNFPSYSSYVERVNDTFTLSIDYLDCPFENIKIKARGFDEKGAVPVKDNIQYGIWEQTVTVEVDTTATDSVRATFTNCPSEVKYIDFIIYFTGANSTDIILKDLMYYDGDAILNHDVDTSRVFAEQVTINFADTYFANIYNEKDSWGLCIARPYQEPFTLTSLKASSETVLIPYTKKANEWDKPQQVFLEYLNAKQQVIDIDWEN